MAIVDTRINYPLVLSAEDVAVDQMVSQQTSSTPEFQTRPVKIPQDDDWERSRWCSARKGSWSPEQEIGTADKEPEAKKGRRRRTF